MAGRLRGWLDGEQDRLVWIEFEDYARRVFAGDASDWLRAPNSYVAGVSQAQSIIGSDVLSVDLLAPFLEVREPGNVSPRDLAQCLFESDEPRRFAGEVIDALAHRYGPAVDLVLKIPSPAALLRQLGSTEEPTFDDLDDIGVGLSNLLREFSARGIAGVLIAAQTPLSADDSEALESVTSAARHYAWCVSVSFCGAALNDGESVEMDIDLLLQPDVSIADLRGREDAGMALGGGLGAAYWQGDEVPPPAGRCALYGAIPVDTKPELVVQRVAALK